MSKTEPIIPGGWKIGARCMFSRPEIEGLIASRKVGRIKAYDPKTKIITIAYRGKVFKQEHTLAFGGISGVHPDHVEKDDKPACNLVKLPPVCTVQRITKQEKLYGAIHFSTGANETLCGAVITDKWFILTNDRMGKATCPACLKAEPTRPRYDVVQKTDIVMTKTRPAVPGVYLCTLPPIGTRRPRLLDVSRDKGKLVAQGDTVGIHALSDMENALWSGPLNIST